MFDTQFERLLSAYPAIFLACHRRHIRDDETGSAVSEHQASILDHLHPVRPATLSRLAAHMGVGRSAMSITVTKLVRGGYISRRRAKSDRRSVNLTLTPAGARVKEHNSFLDPELARDLFRLMPSVELQKSLDGIESLARYANVLLRRRSRSHTTARAKAHKKGSRI